MGQALYRKYRPKNLAEIIGQEHITATLKNAIKNGKISHAYLLTGPRGVGKTSIARILAHEVNGIEYIDDQMHMDIIEIDAASNRRIDEIRDLRDKVHILPTSSKYKVYIIDEVHMLTREAFNALLKTLEEPPEHAIFILATTESHKLPETIVSRTQHFTFKPIDLATLVGHLRSITKSEKVAIDDEALSLIAEHGDGSFRDSISLLDQARSVSDHITTTHVQQLLGIAPAAALAELLDIVMQGTAKQLFDCLAKLRQQGLQSSIIAKQLGQKIRENMMDSAEFQTPRTVRLLESLLGVSASAHADRQLEIVLLDYIFANNAEINQPRVSDNSLPPTKPSPEMIPVPQSPKLVQPKQAVVVDVPKVKKVEKVEPKTPDSHTKETTLEPVAKSESKLKKTQPSDSESDGFNESLWPIIVAGVKKTNNTLFGILKMADMTFDSDSNTLTLSFKFAFHKKQVTEAKNRKIIEDLIKQQSGQEVIIVCELLQKGATAVSSSHGSTKEHLDTVSNIFGGGEVLESES